MARHLSQFRGDEIHEQRKARTVAEMARDKAIKLHTLAELNAAKVESKNKVVEDELCSQQDKNVELTSEVS